MFAKYFAIREFNAHQREAIVQFVEGKTDIFIDLPTVCGKSPINQALPLVFVTML